MSDAAQLTRLHTDARAIFQAGLRAVEPAAAIAAACRRQGNRLIIGDETIDLSDCDRIWVVGAGKASAPMARAVEDLLGDRISGGMVVVKYGHTVGLDRIPLMEAAHPVPDDHGVAGAQAILSVLEQAGPKDLVLALMSGGGSALLPLPAEGLTLADKQATIQVLMACGATIHEINTIRKHLSAIKGGRMAQAAHPARLVSLIISDVVGDDLDVIASGPTVPDSSTFSDCLSVVTRYGIADQLPDPVMAHLQAGARSDGPAESPKTGDPIFNRTQTRIIAGNGEALAAAAAEARKRGYTTLVLSSTIEGDTHDVARVHTAIAREVILSGQPAPAPACILSGGETTVHIRGTGKGGRNQEFALVAAIDLDGVPGSVILSGGTDGNDGPTDAAGAVADGTTVSRAQAKGLNPDSFLANNDAYHFFDPIGDLVITGPTNTNVMDLRIVLVDTAIGENTPT